LKLPILCLTFSLFSQTNRQINRQIFWLLMPMLSLTALYLIDQFKCHSSHYQHFTRMRSTSNFLLEVVTRCFRQKSFFLKKNRNWEQIKVKSKVIRTFELFLIFIIDQFFILYMLSVLLLKHFMFVPMLRSCQQ